MTQDVRGVAQSALVAESQRFHAAKAWCARQVAVDAELARRATALWRREDVFGPQSPAFPIPAHWTE